MAEASSEQRSEGDTPRRPNNNQRRSNPYSEEMQNTTGQGNGRVSQQERPAASMQEQFELRRREQRRQQFERRRREVEREFIHQTDRFSTRCPMCRTFVYTLRIQQATFDERIRRQQEDFERQLGEQRDQFKDLMDHVSSRFEQESDSSESEEETPTPEPEQPRYQAPFCGPYRAVYQGPPPAAYGGPPVTPIPGPSFMPPCVAHFGQSYAAPYPQQFQSGCSYQQQPVRPTPQNQSPWNVVGPRPGLPSRPPSVFPTALPSVFPTGPPTGPPPGPPPGPRTVHPIVHPTGPPPGPPPGPRTAHPTMPHPFQIPVTTPAHIRQHFANAGFVAENKYSQ